jgi:hypothetical protein
VTVDFKYLSQSISQGNWILLLAIILFIGLSAAFSIIILRLLLDLTHVRIPSRFDIESPETFFEKAWMGHLYLLNLFLRGTIRAGLMSVGFFGAIIFCFAALDGLVGIKIIRILGVQENYYWLTLGIIGAILMLAALVISNDIRAKRLGILPWLIEF